MWRFFDSLRGQLVLLIIAALAAAQAVSLWLFVDERGLAVRAAGAPILFFKREHVDAPQDHEAAPIDAALFKQPRQSGDLP